MPVADGRREKIHHHPAGPALKLCKEKVLGGVGWGGVRGRGRGRGGEVGRREGKGPVASHSSGKRRKRGLIREMGRISQNGGFADNFPKGGCLGEGGEGREGGEGEGEMRQRQRRRGREGVRCG